MAKDRSNGLWPTMGGVFCLFVVFLHCVGMLTNHAWSLQALIMPSVWLVLGLCLMTKRRNWLIAAGMLPLVLLTIMSARGPLPMGSVEVFLKTLACRFLPAAGMAMLFLLTLLTCLRVALDVRRSIWWLPILFVLPSCILQYGNTLPWAEFGVVAAVSLWMRPSGK